MILIPDGRKDALDVRFNNYMQCLLRSARTRTVFGLRTEAFKNPVVKKGSTLKHWISNPSTKK